jgi:hypothetical protein
MFGIIKPDSLGNTLIIIALVGAIALFGFFIVVSLMFALITLGMIAVEIADAMLEGPMLFIAAMMVIIFLIGYERESKHDHLDS